MLQSIIRSVLCFVKR